jgi:hypothetical protein
VTLRTESDPPPERSDASTTKRPRRRSSGQINRVNQVNQINDAESERADDYHDEQKERVPDMERESGTKLALSATRSVRLRGVGVQIDALNDTLKAQLSLLDDDELAVLQSIHDKLNSGLDERLKEAADTVGGFVW